MYADLHHGEHAGARAGEGGAGMRFLRQAGLMLWKDLVVEFRARDVLTAMVFFACMVVLVFSLAFVRDGRPVGDVAGGILWVSLAFSGALGLGRNFEREREADTLHGLLMSPADRGAILVGKALGVTVFMSVTAAVVAPLIAVLFDAPLGRDPLPLALLLLLGSFGFAIVGAIFGTLLLKARARDVLLAVILYPLTVPALIAGTVGTSALLDARPQPGRAWFWIQALSAFDLIFLVVALWAFEALTTE